MSWDFRRLEASDEQAFQEFYARRIGAERMRSRFRWLYRGNPHGDALTWLALTPGEGRIVGCTSIFPRRMLVRGEAVLGSHGGDAYVDPDLRRRGIAKALHELSLTETRAAGIRLNYGFPVPKNLGAFLKVGADAPGRFQILRWRLTSAPVVEKLRLGPALSGALRSLADPLVKARARRRLAQLPSAGGELLPIRRFGPAHDELASASHTEFAVSCLRDSAFLNWRYFDNPSQAHACFNYVERGAVQGFVVLEDTGERCVIFDLLVRDPALHLAPLLTLVLERAQAASTGQVRFMSNPTGTYAEAFARCGFHEGGRGMSNPLMVLVEPGDPARSCVADLASWYLTYGDEDRESVGH